MKKFSYYDLFCILKMLIFPFLLSVPNFFLFTSFFFVSIFFLVVSFEMICMFGWVALWLCHGSEDLQGIHFPITFSKDRG